jgi:hypothetical protein
MAISIAKGLGNFKNLCFLKFPEEGFAAFFENCAGPTVGARLQS